MLVGAFVLALLIQLGALAILVPIPFLYLARRLTRLGLRLRAQKADWVLQNESRAPVLYLRSFESDKRKIRRSVFHEKEYSGLMKVVMKVLRFFPATAFPLYLRANLKRTDRVEERNIDDLSVLGPVVTLRRPGEWLPQLGAIRIASEQTDWQTAVLSLMEKAQLIVMETGASQGLRWEFRRAFDLTPFKPILVCAPPIYDDALLTPTQQYQMFRRALCAEVPSLDALFPHEIGATTHFFLASESHLEEFVSDGPPPEILDRMRPGSTEKLRKSLKRRLVISVALSSAWVLVTIGIVILIATQN